MPRTKKTKKVEVRLDEELHRQAAAYAEKHGASLGAILRAILRYWTNPEDPYPLPPGVEEEKKRPPRRRKKTT